MTPGTRRVIWKKSSSQEMVYFGLIVLGPPGTGKTTFCHGLQMLTGEIERKCATINLDFANDILPYKPTIDVRNLITLQEAMDQYGFGPNGGTVFCMEYLLENVSWLIEEIMNYPDHYLIFDCPGQIELYTHHSCVQDIVETLAKELDIRLCSVHLVDSFHCTQPATFISSVLLVTSSMLRLALPHVNVLTKVDLLKYYGQLPFNLDFFTDMMDLTPLLKYVNANVLTTEQIEREEAERAKKYQNRGEVLDGEEDSEDEHDETEDSKPRIQSSSQVQVKFQAMTKALCEVVNDYALVSFYPMNVEDVTTVARVLAATDRANGYSMTEAYAASNPTQEAATWLRPPSTSTRPAVPEPEKPSAKRMFQFASENSNLESSYQLSRDIQEKYGYS